MINQIKQIINKTDRHETSEIAKAFFQIKELVENYEEDPKTFQLKVAVNRRGRLIVIEDFPDDERHAGLHEMVPDLEDGEYQVIAGNNIQNQEPGIYLADVTVDTYDGGRAGPEYQDAFLRIVKFTKV